MTLSGGEVFLRRDFLDIVELARKKRFAVRIYTSGTLIDEEKADRLKALQVSEIHISVYSPDPAVHDAFTGIPRSWEKSTRALKMLRERGLRTVLKANVLTINVDALEGLLALAQDLDADYQLDPTVKPKMNGDTSALRYAVSPEVLAQKVLSRPELHKFVSLEEAEGICDGQNPRTGGGGMCAAAMGLITVHADGGVSPCALFPVSGGNARSERIEDIWKSSPLFETVRNQTFAGMTSCSSCSVQAGCSPCMAYALVEHGDHRACNASSLQYAQATAEHARLLKRAHEKNSAGHPLPLVGDATVPDLDPERSSKRPLSSETG